MLNKTPEAQRREQKHGSCFENYLLLDTPVYSYEYSCDW